MKDTIVTKYRPTSFDAVLGNEAAVKALASAVRGPTCPHTFLFTGNSGIGKTTLARIIANEVNAFTNEIDAASKSGVDDTRKLVEACGYKPLELDGKKNVLYIIDECGSLSEKAWEPLLKLTEDPPSFLYICLATTEKHKIPDTIKTRAYTVALKPLKSGEIEDLLLTVAELEGWEVANGVFQAIVQASEGSARLALNILQAGHAAKDRNELSEIIAKVESENNSCIKLCQYLLKNGRNWREISKMMSDVDDPEEALVLMARYVSSAILRSEEAQVTEFSKLLHAFTRFSTFDSKINFVASITWYLYGNVIF